EADPDAVVLRRPRQGAAVEAHRFRPVAGAPSRLGCGGKRAEAHLAGGEAGRQRLGEAARLDLEAVVEEAELRQPLALQARRQRRALDQPPGGGAGHAAELPVVVLEVAAAGAGVVGEGEAPGLGEARLLAAVEVDPVDGADVMLGIVGIGGEDDALLGGCRGERRTDRGGAADDEEETELANGTSRYTTTRADPTGARRSWHRFGRVGRWFARLARRRPQVAVESRRRLA